MPLCGLGCCQFNGGGSVVVESLFYIPPLFVCMIVVFPDNARLLFDPDQDRQATLSDLCHTVRQSDFYHTVIVLGKTDLNNVQLTTKNG